MRGRNNLSVAQMETEPERALQTVYEGIELARRLGQRGMFNWLVGTYAMYSGAIGHSWDRAQEQTEETLAASPNQYDRARALMTRNLLQVRRGERLDELVPEVAAAAEGITDGQVVGGLDYLRAEVALVQGRLSETQSMSVRALEHWIDSTPFVVQPAIHAAAASGRLADALVLKRLVDTHPLGTPITVAARAWATAVVDALDGRPQEALRGFRTAVELLRSIGLQFDAATAVIDVLRLFPDDPEVRGWAPFAREVLERVGAVPYLSMLDDALAGGRTTSAPTRSARTAEEKAASTA
jgi:hypothetical protein